MSCARAFLLLIAMLLPAGARAQARARITSDSGAIVALEHTWLQTRDTTVLVRILASDFVHIAPGGHFLNRAEHLAWVATHPRPSDVHTRFVELRVRLYGNAAVATGVVLAEDAARHELRRTAFTDVFVKRGNQWQAVSAQEDELRSAARQMKEP